MIQSNAGRRAAAAHAAKLARFSKESSSRVVGAMAPASSGVILAGQKIGRQQRRVGSSVTLLRGGA